MLIFVVVSKRGAVRAAFKDRNKAIALADKLGLDWQALACELEQ
jgi:hypothetical protein